MSMNSTRNADFYRDIPVVDLLASGQPTALRAFGAEGRQLWARAALAALSLVAVLLLLLFNGQDQANEEARTESIRASAAADNTINEALDLEVEIAELRAVGDVSGRDFEFLLGDSRLLLRTIRSVVDLEIEGVVVTNVEILGPDRLSATVAVESNSGAIQWRSRLPDMLGVERVLSFDLIEGVEGDEEQLMYVATLVAGGSQ